jgi:Thiolase C-terminal domain-like
VTFAADGTCPLNTSGGQLSAGGFLDLVETIRQLTGQTLGARVPDARLGLVSGYGMVTYDRGVCRGAAVVAK